MRRRSAQRSRGALIRHVRQSGGTRHGQRREEPWRGGASRCRTGCSTRRARSCSADPAEPGDDAGSRRGARRGAGRAGSTSHRSRSSSPRAREPGREARAALLDAERAARANDQPALAAARGRLRASILAGSYLMTLAAVAERDAESAREWLLIRDFRKATRFTRPGVDATLAVRQLARREIGPRRAALGVRKDLLDAYQARVVSELDEASQAAERGFDARARRDRGHRGRPLARSSHRSTSASAARRRGPPPPSTSRLSPPGRHAPRPRASLPRARCWTASWPLPSPPRSRRAARLSSCAFST